MKKDLSIIIGLFAIVAAVVAYQGASGGGFLSGTKRIATEEAKVTPFNNTQTKETATTSNLKSTQVKIMRLKVMAEVANTQDSRSLGLGGRESLAKDGGMLFVFDTEAKHSFWMKNVKFSIDIVWLDKNKKVIHFVKNAKPDSGENFEIFTPPINAKYVLEVRGGSVEEFGIETGTKATFELVK